MPPAPILFLFVDGIGLGAEVDANLFATLPLPGFRAWTDGAAWTGRGALAHDAPSDAPGTGTTMPRIVFKGIDATLGVPGLPQSGTGQSTLFTGTNCAKLMGRHYGPWPPTVTHALLDSESLFHRIEKHDRGRVLFANAYPDVFFERRRSTGRWPTTTRAAQSAGLRLRTLEDLAAGRALAADITGRGLSAFPRAPHPVSEQVAAERLVALVASHRVVVFEYFHTDKAGHSTSRDELSRVLVSLDTFLLALFHAWPVDATLVVTSDHGNAEDLSVKTHTRNSVPLLVRGPLAGHFSDVRDLTGVTPAMMRALGQRGTPSSSRRREAL